MNERGVIQVHKEDIFRNSHFIGRRMNMKKILFFSVVVLCNFRFGLISAETVEEHVENVLTADHRCIIN